MLGSNTTANDNVALVRMFSIKLNWNEILLLVPIDALTKSRYVVAIGNNACCQGTNNCNTCVCFVNEAGAQMNETKNTLVGYYCGKDLDSGEGNTALGYYAFASDQNSSVTGQNNTCIGRAAGTQISSGQKNVLLGCAAGGGIQNGTSNVCIGQKLVEAI